MTPLSYILINFHVLVKKRAPLALFLVFIVISCLVQVTELGTAWDSAMQLTTTDAMYISKDCRELTVPECIPRTKGP